MTQNLLESRVLSMIGKKRLMNKNKRLTKNMKTFRCQKSMKVISSLISNKTQEELLKGSKCQHSLYKHLNKLVSRQNRLHKIQTSRDQRPKYFILHTRLSLKSSNSNNSSNSSNNSNCFFSRNSKNNLI